jgi:hypothetical protein
MMGERPGGVAGRAALVLVTMLFAMEEPAESARRSTAALGP